VGDVIIGHVFIFSPKFTGR